MSRFVACAALVFVAISPSIRADADTTPSDPGTPATVSADPLPTVQVNGVVWSQVVVGNTVYAAGSFTTARPAGAAPGTQTTKRNNLLAYDITTGKLITSFAPDLNGQALVVKASPDKTRIYVGGMFTTANGLARSRVVAYSTSTGKVITTFAPTPGATVRSITGTNATVYLGGDFTTVSGLPRPYLVAVDAVTGKPTSYNPKPNSSVTAMTLAAADQKLVIGGRFTKVGSTAAYGMAALHRSTGAQWPWAVASTIRNAGVNSDITSLSSDATSVYGSGYVYGAGGNFEGTFRADAATGDILWMEDCHGDSYSAFATASIPARRTRSSIAARVTTLASPASCRRHRSTSDSRSSARAVRSGSGPGAGAVSRNRASNACPNTVPPSNRSMLPRSVTGAPAWAYSQSTSPVTTPSVGSTRRFFGLKSLWTRQ